jgi:hypothetical protein
MSLHDLAKEMASKGRGDDSVLIHMTPGEVGGLQQLAMAHGGSLTINPDTGLPEAGILKSLLPMLIGAVLTPLTGGLINPMTAGLLVGGVEGLRTGDIGKGLMAGLGAYGGAGLSAGLAGLGGIGAKGATTAAGGFFSPTGGMAAFNTGAAGAGTAGAGAAGTAAGAAGTEAAKAVTREGIRAAGKQALGAGYQGAQPSIGAFFKAPGQVAKAGFNAIGEGAKTFAGTPLQSLGQLGTSLGAPGVAALGGSLATAMTPEQKMPDMTKPETSFYKTTYNPGTVNPRFGEPGQSYFVGQGYGPGTRSKTYQETPYTPAPGMAAPSSGGLMDLSTYMQQPTFSAAEGGPVPMPTPSYPMSGIGQPGYSQPLNFSRPSEPLQDYEPQINPTTGDQLRMAGGGLTSLGSYSDGGQLLKGPGDGMSDDIPAMIGGEEPQKAALADGEFVVPADVVSGIGNGSTEAGSRKLYAMMDRIRMARTGRDKQAPEIDADKYLPA